MTFVLLVVVYISLWTLSQAAPLLPNGGLAHVLKLSLLLFLHSLFTENRQKYPSALKDSSLFNLNVGIFGVTGEKLT